LNKHPEKDRGKGLSGGRKLEGTIEDCGGRVFQRAPQEKKSLNMFDVRSHLPQGRDRGRQEGVGKSRKEGGGEKAEES